MYIPPRSGRRIGIGIDIRKIDYAEPLLFAAQVDFTDSIFNCDNGLFRCDIAEIDGMALVLILPDCRSEDLQHVKLLRTFLRIHKTFYFSLHLFEIGIVPY